MSRGATDHALVQHETPQQIFSINRTMWREKTFMSSYFQEGDWQVQPPRRTSSLIIRLPLKSSWSV